MRRIAFDALWIGFLAVCQIVLINYKWPLPARDFIASYNPIIWAVFTGLIFGLISIFWWNIFRSQHGLLIRLLEIIGILLAAHALALFYYMWKNPAEDNATVIWFSILFMLVPALLSSTGVLLLLNFVSRFILASPR